MDVVAERFVAQQNARLLFNEPGEGIGFAMGELGEGFAKGFEVNVRKQGAKNEGKASGQLSPAAREILIQECIDRVMKELENKNER